MFRVAVAAVAALVALTGGSCADQAAPTTPGSVAAASPAAASPAAHGSVSTEATMAASASPTTTFALTSTAFSPGGEIPRTYTCDGPGRSVPLTWSGVPSGTLELAVLVVDPDANGFVHWVAAGIAPSSPGLPDGASGSTGVGVEGRNGAGRTGWTGPCPPSGTHHYQFTLFAVSKRLGLASGVTADELRNAVKGATIGTATLVGTYKRG
jgi:Raf kinase inhibitor-like YbhB/YbcL family protein